MPDDGELVRLKTAQVSRLREEKRRVRAPIYDLAMRLKAGDEGARADMDAAIKRSDELENEIKRLETEIHRLVDPAGTDGENIPAVMYGPPVAPMYGPPPVPRPGPPAPSHGTPAVGPDKPRGFFDRLFRRK